MGRKIRILSLDGGGIRGIITAKILVNIEKMLKEEYGEDFLLSDYFDIVAGTSTGGIITSLMLLTDSKGNVLCNTNDILNLYLNKNKLIFKKSFLHKIKTVFGFFGAKFENNDYEKLLESYFGNTELKDLKKPTVICSYDTNLGKCILFKQHYALENQKFNFYLKDVVRATSSAPTYFRPVKIKSLTGDEYTLVDGGTYANNPSMCALVEVNKIFKKENGEDYKIEDIKILSIGTGHYNIRYKWEKIVKWGIVKWILPFIDMSMSATNEVTDYQIKKLYEYSNFEDGYLRLNVNLNKGESSIDNIKEDNLEDLVKIGDRIFEINKEIIKKFIKL